jgi:hypothetical protein
MYYHAVEHLLKKNCMMEIFVVIGNNWSKLGEEDFYRVDAN